MQQQQDAKHYLVRPIRVFVSPQLSVENSLFSLGEPVGKQGVAGEVFHSPCAGFCVKTYRFSGLLDDKENENPINDLLQPMNEIGILTRLNGLPGVISIAGFALYPKQMRILLPAFHQDLENFLQDCDCFLNNSSFETSSSSNSKTPGLDFLLSHLPMPQPAAATKQYKKNVLETFAADIIRQLLCALVLMHDRGVVHADIKPSNIVLRFHQNEHRIEAVFCDFSHSRLLELGQGLLSDYKEMVTTEEYRAPELSHQKYEDSFSVPNNSMVYSYYSHKIDIYSLGRVIQKMAEKMKSNPSAFMPSVAFDLMMQKRTSCRISAHELAMNLKLKQFVKTTRRAEPGQAAKRSIRLIQEVAKSIPSEKLSDAFACVEKLQHKKSKFASTNSRRLFFHYFEKNPNALTAQNVRLVLFACHVISVSLDFDVTPEMFEKDTKVLLGTIFDITFTLEGQLFPLMF